MTRRLVTVTSPKHPGAVFIGWRVFGRRRLDFVCKLYPKHADELATIVNAITRRHERCELIAAARAGDVDELFGGVDELLPPRG